MASFSEMLAVNPAVRQFFVDANLLFIGSGASA
jgi:hypothetical protein